MSESERWMLGECNLTYLKFDYLNGKRTLDETLLRAYAQGAEDFSGEPE